MRKAGSKEGEGKKLGSFYFHTKSFITKLTSFKTSFALKALAYCCEEPVDKFAKSSPCDIYHARVDW